MTKQANKTMFACTTYAPLRPRFRDWREDHWYHQMDCARHPNGTQGSAPTLRPTWQPQSVQFMRVYLVCTPVPTVPLVPNDAAVAA